MYPPQQLIKSDHTHTHTCIAHSKVNPYASWWSWAKLKVLPFNPIRKCNACIAASILILVNIVSPFNCWSLLVLYPSFHVAFRHGDSPLVLYLLIRAHDSAEWPINIQVMVRNEKWKPQYFIKSLYATRLPPWTRETAALNRFRSCVMCVCAPKAHCFPSSISCGNVKESCSILCLFLVQISNRSTAFNKYPDTTK